MASATLWDRLLLPCLPHQFIIQVYAQIFVGAHLCYSLVMVISPFSHTKPSYKEAREDGQAGRQAGNRQIDENILTR